MSRPDRIVWDAVQIENPGNVKGNVISTFYEREDTPFIRKSGQVQQLAGVDRVVVVEQGEFLICVKPSQRVRERVGRLESCRGEGMGGSGV